MIDRDGDSEEKGSLSTGLEYDFGTGERANGRGDFGMRLLR